MLASALHLLVIERHEVAPVVAPQLGDGGTIAAAYGRGQRVGRRLGCRKALRLGRRRLLRKRTGGEAQHNDLKRAGNPTPNYTVPVVKLDPFNPQPHFDPGFPYVKQRDVLIDHRLLHLLRVLEHEVPAGPRVLPGQPHRLLDPRGGPLRIDPVPVREDGAERDRQSRGALPPFPEVGQRMDRRLTAPCNALNSSLVARAGSKMSSSGNCA